LIGGGPTQAWNVVECNEQCLDNSDCSFWVYEKRKKLCYLYEMCKKYSAKGYVSGQAGCPSENTEQKSRICPPYIAYGGVDYSFYGEATYPYCKGIFSRCIYKHAWTCYCFEDGVPRPVPCYYSPKESKNTKSVEFSADNPSLNQIVPKTIGTYNTTPFNDLADGKKEILSIELFPAIYSSITVICGGIKVNYRIGGTVTHGVTDQTVPGHPPVQIDLNINNFITGAAGRYGSKTDQITLITTPPNDGGFPIPHVCGGNFGQPVIPPPNPPHSIYGFCYLSSIGGSTQGANGFLENLELFWQCQQQP